MAVPWPQVLHDAMSTAAAVTTFSENAYSFECFGGGNKDHTFFVYGLLVATSLFPLGFSALLAVYWMGLVPICPGRVLTCGAEVIRSNLLLAWKKEKKISEEERKNKKKEKTNKDGNNKEFRPSNTDALLSSMLLFWFLMLPSLVRVGFAAFQCRYVGVPALEKSLYLFLSLEETCWEGRHLFFTLGVALPMLLLYAAIAPGMSLLRLRRAGRARLTDPSLMLRWGFLHSGYRAEKYWWEFVTISRKILIIGASTFIASETNQLQVVLAVVIVSLHLHNSNAPFGVTRPDQRLLHQYELLSLLLLTFLLWCGLYFSSATHLCQTTQFGWCTFLACVVVTLNIGYLLMLVRRCGLACWKRRAEAQAKLLSRASESESLSNIAQLFSKGSTGPEGKQMESGMEIISVEDNPLGRNDHMTNPMWPERSREGKTDQNTSPPPEASSPTPAQDTFDLDISSSNSDLEAPPGWKAWLDEVSGNTYYTNMETGESVWAKLENKT
jgi:hypothetical protein